MQWKEKFFRVFHSKIREVEVVLQVEAIVKVEIRAFRLFRIGEDRVLVSSQMDSKVLAIRDNVVEIVKDKEIIIGENTVFAGKSTNGLLQVTSNTINLCGKTQIFFTETITHACISGQYLAVATFSVVFIYKNFELVRQIDMEGEILSLCEKLQCVIIGVYRKGLWRLQLAEYKVSEFSDFFPNILSFYYAFAEFEIAGNHLQTFIKGKSLWKVMDIVVFRVSLVKESLNYIKVFLESTDTSYLLSLPSLAIEKVTANGLISLYGDIYLAAFPNHCEIGNLTQKITEKEHKLDLKITKFFPSQAGNFVITDEKILLFSQNFKKISEFLFKTIGPINYCGALPGILIFSNEIQGNFCVYFINIFTMEVLKYFLTDQALKGIDEQVGYFVLKFVYKVMVFSSSCELICELKFQNLEYDELAKKLEGPDIEAIIDLKVSEPHQAIIGFYFVNTGRTPIEVCELSKKEFICVTSSSIYWGILSNSSFETLTFHVLFT